MRLPLSTAGGSWHRSESALRLTTGIAGAAAWIDDRRGRSSDVTLRCQTGGRAARSQYPQRTPSPYHQSVDRLHAHGVTQWPRRWPGPLQVPSLAAAGEPTQLSRDDRLRLGARERPGAAAPQCFGHAGVSDSEDFVCRGTSLLLVGYWQRSMNLRMPRPPLPGTCSTDSSQPRLSRGSRTRTRGRWPVANMNAPGPRRPGPPSAARLSASQSPGHEFSGSHLAAKPPPAPVLGGCCQRTDWPGLRLSTGTRAVY
jgi:hypothetical protein